MIDAVSAADAPENEVFFVAALIGDERQDRDCPTISAGEKPNNRSAALFQLVTVPLRSLLMIASSDDSTIAAR